MAEQTRSGLGWFERRRQRRRLKARAAVIRRRNWPSGTPPAATPWTSCSNSAASSERAASSGRNAAGPALLLPSQRVRPAGTAPHRVQREARRAPELRKRNNANQRTNDGRADHARAVTRAVVVDT